MGRRERSKDQTEARIEPMKSLVALAAVAALSFGFANTASAETLDLAPKAESDGAANAGYYWQYRTYWRGNCFYRTFYITNGYAWRYRYRYTCV